MGAHPKAPSRLRQNSELTPLDEIIRSKPEETLGAAVFQTYGPRLPFLFKVLAAERGLSIQAHPNLEQARAGFGREEEAGIPIDAANRNYRDDNHKPELICALDEFWALEGFRPLAEIARELSAVDLAPVHDQLRRLDEGGGLRELFAAVMTSSGDMRKRLIDGALAHASARGKRGKKDRYFWVQELHRQFGEDIGVIAPLYLNCVELEAGQALYLSAGVLHAYLSGIGVELMANSDNVLRGGCTEKHVDVDELLSVLSFEARDAEVLAPRRISPIEEVYPSPAPEFQLSRLTLDGSVPRAIETPDAPEILLCVDGNLVLSEGNGDTLDLRRGESIFVPASVARISMRGAGSVFRARVPLA